MTEIDDYYVFQDNYYQLKELAVLLKDHTNTDTELIEYCKTNNIDTNSYITTFKNGTYVPIIWQCSLLPNRVKFFKWLIANGANTKLIVDGEKDKMYDILFACNEKYFKLLVKRNKKLSNKISVLRQIKNKLTYGNYRRVLYLKKMNLISETEFITALKSKDILLLTTKILIDRLGLICRTHNSQSEINQVIDKYIIVFKLIIQINKEIDPNVIKTLIQYYQHRLLSLLDIPDKLKVTYHVDMDQKVVAILRTLLNDRNYVLTCDALSFEPDSRCY
jgi:hypothetical protein